MHRNLYYNQFMEETITHEKRISPLKRANYENAFCVSNETIRELFLLWNKKPDIRRWWKFPYEIIRIVEDEYGISGLYLHKEHYETYSKLHINEVQDYFYPSDHLIISHAITNRIALISADTRFPWYRNQGLELIYDHKE